MVQIKSIIVGTAADICVIQNREHQSDVERFMNSLPIRDGIRVKKLLGKFSSVGYLHNPSQFRFEENGIFSFKMNQVRILCCFLPDAQKRTQVLLLGYIKKSQKAPRRLLDQAMTMLTRIKEDGYERI